MPGASWSRLSTYSCFRSPVSNRVGIYLAIQRGISAWMWKKSEKSLEMGSRGLPAPGPGQKSQKRVKNELKSLKKVSFELVFNSFLTFLSRPREPISRLFSEFFTFGLKYPLNGQRDPNNWDGNCNLFQKLTHQYLKPIVSMESTEWLCIEGIFFLPQTVCPAPVQDAWLSRPSSKGLQE